MHESEAKTAESSGATDSSLQVATAVRDCLAPLRVAKLFEPVAEYVLRGTAPEILARLRERPTGADKVAKPDGYWPAELESAIADLHPGWTTEDAKAARRTIYRFAPIDVLARFGQVLHAADESAAESGEPSWLLVLADDVTRVHDEVNDTDAENVQRRWDPHTFAEVARAGDTPGRTPAHATLSALLYADSLHWGHRRRRLLESDAGVEFLARHTDELADVVAGLDEYDRKHVASLCARSPQAHAVLAAALAVDPDAGVRAEALDTLSRLDGHRQVDLLRGHLKTASPDHLSDALARLGDLDGGVAAIEETLAYGDTGPQDPERERLLRRAAFRVRVLREAQAVAPLPPVPEPQDADLAQDLRTLASERRSAEDRAWHGVEGRLNLMPDVRALRDTYRAAGVPDADRRTATLLVTRTTSSYEKIGSLITPQDAERWWPLFAERLDLADEYLDGGDGKRHPDQSAVDTRAMILTILERFPAVPEALVPRLTSIALGASRHRLPARRVLADYPDARAAAKVALSDADTETCSSAAEWLVGLGEPEVAAPEPGWEFGEGMLHPSVRALPASTLWWLDRFREKALDLGVPAGDVDRWLGLARPKLRTARDGSGPVHGRLGSPLMLPPDVPTPGMLWDDDDPDDVYEHQLIVTIDLSAIAPGDTDLPLPADGHLLLFANIELDDFSLPGGAVYVPAGAPVEARETKLDYEPYEYDSPEDLDEELRRTGELRLVPGVGLPSCPVNKRTLNRHPYAETLQEAWSEQSDEGGKWQIGGYAADFDGYGDPAPASGGLMEAGRGPGTEDEVLLTQWIGVPMGILYWTITRQDLEERRFDRVSAWMYSNP